MMSLGTYLLLFIVVVVVVVVVVIVCFCCYRFGYTAEPLGSWVEQRAGVKVTTPTQ